jgi:hypothetical protein
VLQKFVTGLNVIPGKLAKLARPGIQELNDVWIPVFMGMTAKRQMTNSINSKTDTKLLRFFLP